MNNIEIRDAIKYWAFISIGVIVCIFVGKLFAQTGSIYIPLFFVALTVAGVTFYSPKTALSFIVLSMLLSPKIPGMQIVAASHQNTAVIRLNDILLGIVFFAWMARTAIRKPASFLNFTPIHLPIFLYTSCYVVSTVIGVMEGRLQLLRSFFFVLKYLEYFLLFFMTVNIVENREDIKRYLRYGWITAIIVTLYGYYQIPSGERITAPFEAPLGASIQEKNAASEPNALGGYYIVVFCVLLSLYTQGDSGYLLFYGASFVLMLFPFLYTLSRSSYLGLAAAIACQLIIMRKRRATLLFAVGLSGMLFFLVPTLRHAVVDRVAYTFTGQESSGTRNTTYTVVSVGGDNVQLEGSAAARFFSWKRIFLVKFPQHPLFGWGVTGVGLSDTEYPLVIGETGLVGFSFFFWMLYRIWKCAGFIFRSSRYSLDRGLALGLMTALVGLLFHGLGANTFIIVHIMEPFWFLVALIARLYVNQRQEELAGSGRQ